MYCEPNPELWRQMTCPIICKANETLDAFLYQIIPCHGYKVTIQGALVMGLVGALIVLGVVETIDHIKLFVKRKEAGEKGK